MWTHPLGRLIGLWNALRRRGHPRDNIYAHYDLGNDFYKLWLDDQLLYTCAYFPTPDVSLEEAQIGKMDHICRKLDLRPGERVVEAGCGWGSLALHMAEHYGVHVRAFNLSHEQIAYAREHAERRGLARQVEFVEDSYKSIAGVYDAFVSVGMLEHVGLKDFPVLGNQIERCLEPHGRGLIHSIGRAHSQPMSVWMEREIFPGACIPSLKQILEVLEPNRMAVLDVENLRLHYARTLEHWLDRFEKSVDRIESMYDSRFVRVWRMYLSSSIASFRVGSCQLYQIVFTRQNNNAVRWTRAGVYQSDA
jgi:cyclopropane-fatty-acyl-phospholipid synthase